MKKYILWILLSLAAAALTLYWALFLSARVLAPLRGSVAEILLGLAVPVALGLLCGALRVPWWCHVLNAAVYLCVIYYTLDLVSPNRHSGFFSLPDWATTVMAAAILWSPQVIAALAAYAFVRRGEEE